MVFVLLVSYNGLGAAGRFLNRIPFISYLGALSYGAYIYQGLFFHHLYWIISNPESPLLLGLYVVFPFILAAVSMRFFERKIQKKFN
jgi:peptidoglycan/LPS O-acetylase OafA/YrhL